MNHRAWMLAHPSGSAYAESSLRKLSLSSAHLPLRRPWQAMRLAYDRFTVLWFVPFISVLRFEIANHQSQIAQLLCV